MSSAFGIACASTAPPGQKACMSDSSTIGKIPSAALALGLAGLIPFFAGAAAQWVSLPLLPQATGLKLTIVYGAIILSFLGGIRWGTAIGPYDTGRQTLEFSASVLGSLAGLAAVFLPPIPALSLLIVALGVRPSAAAPELSQTYRLPKATLVVYYSAIVLTLGLNPTQRI